MTTIVYNHKTQQIGVDSRSTCEWTIINDEKLKAIENEKGLWFPCGAVADFSSLCKLSHNEKVDLIPDARAFLVEDTGVYIVGVSNSGYCCYEKQDSSMGIGTGGYFALSALDFGQSTKQAVEYAATRDAATGGKIRVYDIASKSWL